MSWIGCLLTYKCYQMNIRRMGITEFSRRVWLFSANKIKSSESFSKQPIQLMVQLNSSLRHIIVTQIISTLLLSSYLKVYKINLNRIIKAIILHLLVRNQIGYDHVQCRFSIESLSIPQSAFANLLEGFQFFFSSHFFVGNSFNGIILVVPALPMEALQG